VKQDTPVDLVWRQTQLAWIAARPDDADERGRPVTRGIDLSVCALCEYLLKLAGTHICVPFGERNSERLLKRGQLIPAIAIQAQPGKTSECHANSARLWKQNRKTYKIVTGYALSAHDNMWRQHSWLIQPDGHIVETTESRFMYYGMSLNIIEAFWFCMNNEG
jgi:hypothetical protein